MEFRQIPSQEIDKNKWDACVRTYPNGLIYATTAYLDTMAENWTGIVFGDYEAIMPIAWKIKYGIQYCYSIPFIQQLGLIGKEGILNHSDIKDIILSITKYGDYNFNFLNSHIIHNDELKLCNNYILPLDDYHIIHQNYSSDLLSNLKKRELKKFLYSDGDINKALDIFYSLYHNRTPHVTKDDYENFRRLCHSLRSTGNAFVKQVVNTKSEILAIAIFFHDEKRIYNMANSTTDAGRKTGANHLLFDELIHEYAGKNLILDFEGSDIAGIKSFYEKFGAINQPYFRWHFNKLPWPLRMFKQ